MNLLKRVLFLLFISISTSYFLYADGEDISITLSDASGVYEYHDKARFEIKLSENPNWCDDVVVSYTTVDGNATAGSDYNKTEGNVTLYGSCLLRSATNSAIVEVPIINDNEYEDNETFYLKISNSQDGYSVTKDMGSAIIYNDDIGVKIHNRYENEGDSNWTINVYVKLLDNKVAPEDILVEYSTKDSSAIAGKDYISKNGSIIIPKDSNYGTIPITIIGNGEINNLKTKVFYVNIDSISKGTIFNNPSTVTLVDDDSPEVYIRTIDTQEGNSSTEDKKIPFIIYLNKEYALDTPLTIKYETITSDSSSSATASKDYIPLSGTITFQKGEKEKIVYVSIIEDKDIEDDEYVEMKISGDYIEQSSVISKILNDDGKFPTLTFTEESFFNQEGNSTESANYINFELSLNAPAPKGSTFQYSTITIVDDDNNSYAKAGEDFEEISKNTYTFNGGETSVTIPIKIIGDTQIELDETLFLKLENPTNLKLGEETEGKGIILNDDGSFPNVFLSPIEISVDEGDMGEKSVDFNITLDKPSIDDRAYVAFRTFNGSAKYEYSDYESIPKQKVFFSIGDTIKNFSVKIKGDTKIERNENFTIRIVEAYHLNINNQTLKVNIINDDLHSDDPFECDENMYISSSTNRETGKDGKMWLHKIKIDKNPFDFEPIEDIGAVELYNATAYNPDDNYIYGLYYRTLIKITKTGKVIDLGTIDGLPEYYNDKQLYAGAIHNGYYYVTGENVKTDVMYRIDLENKDVKEIRLSKKVQIQDFSFYFQYCATRYLYGIDKDGKLTKIDSGYGEVTQIGQDHVGYNFDSSFSDANGRFFANDSNGHGFFEFNLETGEKMLLSNSQPATYNDGANCIKKELIFTDYGDAPHENGKYYGEAWHNIIGGLYLGEKVDHDIMSYSNEGATGDDTNGTDDDDGVTLADGTPLDGIYLEDNKTHQLKVKLSKDGYLRIWIDLNIDRHFDNGHDLVYDRELSAGELSITLPAGLTSHVTTYLRARVSSFPAMDYQGYLQDGEVEDYAIKFGKAEETLNGTFNIERTDSGSFAINTKERNAWFTQIVGRDFDYSLLFYDENMTKEKELSNVVIKVSLIDEDKNISLYDKYAYISESSSRIDNLIPDDLNRLPATKRARFRIYYGIDTNGGILKTSCNSDPQTCFSALSKVTFVDARDNFAIRPAYFHMTIADNNETRRINISPYNTTPLRLASGYDYNLTIIASIYNGTDLNSSIGYKNIINRKIGFLDKTNSACPNRVDFNKNINFIDGKSVSILGISEVGRYALHIEDNNWTKVDILNGDCDINKSYISTDPNLISGCNISNLKDINISLLPHHFDLNLNLKNIPKSSHNDFIYMSDLNSTFNSVGVSYSGDILAKSKDGITTKNFTCGCFGEDVDLELNVTTLSENGEDQPIKTIKGTSIDFVKIVDFNHENNITISKDSSFKNIAITTIPKSKFRDDMNGTLFIDLRYNIAKSLLEPTNPIQIKFHNADINSSNSYSLAEGKDSTNPYIPKGYQYLGDTIKNFYCARVFPDKRVFPRIDFNKKDFVRTPLGVEIFCGVSVPLTYCVETNLTKHTLKSSSPRAQDGWFISIDHNKSIDGNVTKLIPDDPNPNVVTFSTLTTPTFPITLPNGKNGTVITKFSNPAGDKSYKIFIHPSPHLRFSEKTTDGIDYYIINGSDKNSTWTGVGATGKTLEIKINNTSSHKLDW